MFSSKTRDACILNSLAQNIAARLTVPPSLRLCLTVSCNNKLHVIKYRKFTVQTV